jgi:hypothetical protein
MPFCDTFAKSGKVGCAKALKTGEAKTMSSKKNRNSAWRKNICQTYCKKMGQQINEEQIFHEHFL